MKSVSTGMRSFHSFDPLGEKERGWGAFSYLQHVAARIYIFIWCSSKVCTVFHIKYLLVCNSLYVKQVWLLVYLLDIIVFFWVWSQYSLSTIRLMKKSIFDVWHPLKFSLLVLMLNEIVWGNYSNTKIFQTFFSLCSGCWCLNVCVRCAGLVIVVEIKGSKRKNTRTWPASGLRIEGGAWKHCRTWRKVGISHAVQCHQLDTWWL